MCAAKYKLNDPGYLVRKAFTDCELCRWSILHEPGKLKAHFEKYHPLVSMIEYYANYVATRLDAASSDKNRDSICTDVACDASDASDDAASVSGASNNSGGGSRADTPDLREEADQAEVLDKILEYSKFEHLFDGDDNFCCEICGATLKQVNCRDVDSHLRNVKRLFYSHYIGTIKYSRHRFLVPRQPEHPPILPDLSLPVHVVRGLPVQVLPLPGLHRPLERAPPPPPGLQPRRDDHREAHGVGAGRGRHLPGHQDPVRPLQQDGRTPEVVAVRTPQVVHGEHAGGSDEAGFVHFIQVEY